MPGGSCTYCNLYEVKGPLADNVTTPLPTTRDTTIKLLIEGPGTWRTSISVVEKVLHRGRATGTCRYRSCLGEFLALGMGVQMRASFLAHEGHHFLVHAN
jgi:hypothetical protein